MIKLCFVYTPALGNELHAKIMIRSLNRFKDIRITSYKVHFPYRFLNNKIGYRVPYLTNCDLDFYSFRSHVIASYEVKKHILKNRNKYDSMIIHTPNIAYFSMKFMKEIPTVLSLDAPNSVLSNWGWNAKLPYTKFTWKPSIHFEKQSFKKCKKIITMSVWAKNIISDYYKIKPSKIIVIPSPIIIPDINRNYGIKSKPKLLFVGGDFKRKGGNTLLSCFKKYFESNCELHIVTSENVKSGKNVFIYRKISDKKLDFLYREADIFVFPTNLEPFGRVVPEAMSYGLPVITTDRGAMPEIIYNGKCGFLIKPNDIKSLKHKVQLLIEDEKLRKELGKNGREYAKKNFNEKIIVKKIHSIIKKIA